MLAERVFGSLEVSVSRTSVRCCVWSSLFVLVGCRRCASTPDADDADDPADRRPGLHPERPVRAVLSGAAAGLLPRRRPGRHVPERDRRRTSSRSSARARSTSASRTAPASSRRSARASRSSTRPRSTPSFPNVVIAPRRQRIKTAADLQGQVARHSRPLRLELDHAPGAACVGRPDARRHRRSSAIRTSARARRCSRARSTRPPASPTTSPFSCAERLRDDPADGRPDRAAAGPGPDRRTRRSRTKQDALKAFVAATLQRDGGDQGQPAVGPRRLDRGRARAGHRQGRAAGDPGRHGRDLGRVRTLRPTRHRARSTRDAWTRSLEFMRTLPDQNIPAICSRLMTVTQDLSRVTEETSHHRRCDAHGHAREPERRRPRARRARRSGRSTGASGPSPSAGLSAALIVLAFFFVALGGLARPRTDRLSRRPR